MTAINEFAYYTGQSDTFDSLALQFFGCNDIDALKNLISGAEECTFLDETLNNHLLKSSDINSYRHHVIAPGSKIMVNVGAHQGLSSLYSKSKSVAKKIDGVFHTAIDITEYVLGSLLSNVNQHHYVKGYSMELIASSIKYAHNELVSVIKGMDRLDLLLYQYSKVVGSEKSAIQLLLHDCYVSLNQSFARSILSAISFFSRRPITHQLSSESSLVTSKLNDEGFKLSDIPMVKCYKSGMKLLTITKRTLAVIGIAEAVFEVWRTYKDHGDWLEDAIKKTLNVLVSGAMTEIGATLFSLMLFTPVGWVAVVVESAVALSASVLLDDILDAIQDYNRVS